MANFGRIPSQVKQGIIASRALGAHNREITERFGVTEAPVTRTVREARVEELARELESNWSETLISAAKRAVLDALEDSQHYNRGKIGVSVLKGLGLFSAKDSGDTINNTQINISRMSDEELEKLIAEKERLLTRAAEVGLVPERADEGPAESSESAFR